VHILSTAGAFGEGIPGSLFGINDDAPVTHTQACRVLLTAATDPRIAAVLINLQPVLCGFGKLQEFVRHIQIFRATGKRIYVYAETGMYMVMCVSMYAFSFAIFVFTNFAMCSDGKGDVHRRTM
jgi:hypothetical protein